MRLDDDERATRHRDAIRALDTGCNHKCLALKWNLTERQVRNWMHCNGLTDTLKEMDDVRVRDLRGDDVGRIRDFNWAIGYHSAPQQYLAKKWGVSHHAVHKWMKVRGFNTMTYPRRWHGRIKDYFEIIDQPDPYNKMAAKWGIGRHGAWKWCVENYDRLTRHNNSRTRDILTQEKD